jgi:hypothetical protein
MKSIPLNKQFKSIEERVALWKKYYSKGNEKPLLGFFAGSEYPVHRYKAAKNIPIGVELQPDHFDVDQYLDDFDTLFQIHEECGGDFIWSASAFWGIPWLEAIIGCPILLSDYSSGSIHAKMPSNFTGAENIPDFSVDNPWVKKSIEFLEKSSQRSNGRWPIGTTRMRGISDLLSTLFGAEELIMKMMCEPHEIHSIAKKLTYSFIEFGKIQLDHIPLFHGGVGSFYYNCWAPEGTLWHQEDATALLSPELFNEFIRPYDEEIISAFKGCIMHQHSTGYVPTQEYLEMDFLALELHIDEGGPTAKDLFEKHTLILDKKPLIIWGDIPQKDMDWIFSKLSPEGLAVITVVESPEDARIIWNRYFS